jgi:hypothetical protein
MEKMNKKISVKKTKPSSGNPSRLKKRKAMSTFSQKVKKGLKEILEYKQGKRTLRTKLIELHELPLEIIDKGIYRPEL